MPISVSIDAHTNCIRLTVDGRPGPTESHVAVNLMKGYGTAQDRALLVDASALDQLPSSAVLWDVMLPIAREVAAAGFSPIVLVAPTDAQYGVGRMFQAMSEHSGLTFAVFRREDDAARWLDNQRRS